MTDTLFSLDAIVDGLAEFRPLTQADLDRMSSEGRGDAAQEITVLRHRHHALARALAAGMTDAEAGVAAGYSASRVSVLKRSDALKHLIAIYERDISADYSALAEKLVGLSYDAMMELARRFEDEPEAFSNNELKELVKVGADRSGFGPTTKHEVSVHTDMAERMKMAYARAEAVKQRRLAQAVDVEVEFDELS